MRATPTRSRTARVLLVVLAATSLLALAAPASALTPYPSTQAAQLTRTGFTVVASGPISGWYWMRSASYTDSATYRFNNFDPAVLGYDHRMEIFLAPLVTNTTSGGAGWTTRVHVTVTYAYSGGTKTWTYHVTPVNPFPFRSSMNSGGVGYQTYGHQALLQSQFTHGVGNLTVVVTRDSTYSTYGYHPHVAVNAAALSIWYLKS